MDTTTDSIDSTDIYSSMHFLFHTVAKDLQSISKYHSIRFKFKIIGDQNEKVSVNINSGFM